MKEYKDLFVEIGAIYEGPAGICTSATLHVSIDRNGTMLDLDGKQLIEGEARIIMGGGYFRDMPAHAYRGAFCGCYIISDSTIQLIRDKYTNQG